MTETVVDCVCFDCEREPCVECLYVSFPFRPPQPNTPTTNTTTPPGHFRHGRPRGNGAAGLQLHGTGLRDARARAARLCQVQQGAVMGFREI